MKTSRIKIPLTMLATRDDAETCMNDLANIANNQRLLSARRDREVLEIQERYAAGLAQCEQERQQKAEALRAWAEANPSEFPKGRKSLVLTSGTIGFRTGTPKLALLSRALNWDKVLELLRGRWATYIRTKEEVAKDAILAEYAASNDRANFDHVLRTVGMKVTQDESFFAEPDLTQFETRNTVAA